MAMGFNTGLDTEYDGRDDSPIGDLLNTIEALTEELTELIAAGASEAEVAERKAVIAETRAELLELDPDADDEADAAERAGRRAANRRLWSVLPAIDVAALALFAA